MMVDRDKHIGGFAVHLSEGGSESSRKDRRSTRAPFGMRQTSPAHEDKGDSGGERYMSDRPS